QVIPFAETVTYVHFLHRRLGRSTDLDRPAKPKPEMKIIRHRRERRPEWLDGAPQRKPWKKALLIGIQYEQEEGGDKDANPLHGPHSDVEAMGALLIGAYPELSL